MSSRTTSRTITCSISNSCWHKFDSFYRYWLDTRPLIRVALLSLGHCVPVTTVAVCGLGSWALVFHCRLPRQISPSSPNPLSNRSVLHDGRKHKTVVQICCFSLSAAVDGLADGSGECRTSPFNGDAQAETALKDRSVVP